MAVSSFPLPVRVVVWEWQRDDGGYSPYYPEVIQAIEKARTSGQRKLNLGTASRSLTPYTVDLIKSEQIRNDTGMVRGIRRSEISISGTPCHAIWEWQDGSNNFNLYNILAIIEIEEAYNLNQRALNLSVKLSKLPYTIDFTTMHQVRHHFNTRRKIQRTPLPKSLQSYLTNDTSPWTTSSLASGSAAVKNPGHGGLSIGPSGHLSTLIPGTTYNVSLPSVNPSWSGGINSLTTTFDTTPYKNLPSSNSLSMPPVANTKSSPKKGSKGEASKKASKTVTSKASGKAKNKPASMDVTSQTVSTSAKRFKPKKPTTNDSTFAPGMPYLKKVSRVKKEDDGPCPICMSELSEASGFDERNTGVYKLTKCGHMLHTPCVKAYIENSSFSKGNFQCPTCKKIYGIKTGDMPQGTMTVLRQRSSLPGHEGHGTIQITYNFHPGVHMGKRYTTNGFPRTCYLPDSPRGQKVLKLLRKAWDRKLTFTIGTSVTTGAANTIVWNEIHHKTESTTNFSGHGYPDPKYLDNVTAELAAQGVDDSEDEEASSSTVSDSGSSSDSDL